MGYSLLLISNSRYTALLSLKFEYIYRNPVIVVVKGVPTLDKHSSLAMCFLYIIRLSFRAISSLECRRFCFSSGLGRLGEAMLL